MELAIQAAHIASLPRRVPYVTQVAHIGHIPEKTNWIDREFEVMRRLGSGLTVSQIASELTLSAKTVSTYRTRILEKMALETNADLVRYASRYGLIA